MNWAMVVIVALVIWGVVQIAKTRAGIITDEDGNETLAPMDDGSSQAALEEARREIAELRDRVHVLERIATDNNSLDARERARITAEIESLRTPTTKEDLSE